MPNITRGDRPGGLMAYLTGPGRHNEHIEPHLVAGSDSIMAWHGDGELGRQEALDVARGLDQPRRLHGTEIRRGHIWHCSLSLSAAEGPISEEKWAAIAHDFVNELGFTESSENSPCRWVAVHHGQSTEGNDHIHIAVNLVREDGSSAMVWNDYAEAQRLCTGLERRYGLEVLESRAAGYGRRGVTPGEQRISQRVSQGAEGATAGVTAGATETLREHLERRVRGYAAASLDEAEFVRRCRRGGLKVLPRFRAGRDDVITGYSVAVRPSSEDRAAGVRPYYTGGGRLGRDLTLTRLRARWIDPEASPAASAAAASEAAAEWRAAHRGQKIVNRQGRETTRLEPIVWEQCHRDLGRTFQQMRSLAVDDVAGFAHLAHDTAGVLAAWSMRVEGHPGPLAQASRDLSRYSQLRAHQVPAKRVPQPGMREAAMLVLQATSSDRGAASYAILVRQLSKTLEALHEHHRAAGRLQAARAVETSVTRDLAGIAARLPAPPRTLEPVGTGAGGEGSRASEDQAARAAARAAAAGEPAPWLPGSPLPPVSPTGVPAQPANPLQEPQEPAPGERQRSGGPAGPRPVHRPAPGPRRGPGQGPGIGQQ